MSVIGIVIDDSVNDIVTTYHFVGACLSITVVKVYCVPACNFSDFLIRIKKYPIKNFIKKISVKIFYNKLWKMTKLDFYIIDYWVLKKV